MPVKYRPIFVCEGCGEESEDQNSVRLFNSMVKNGDETRIYIQSGMYCINCISLALDFKNENPETVQIVDPSEALAEPPIEAKLNELESELNNMGKQYTELIERTYSSLNEMQHKIYSFEDLPEKIKELYEINKNIFKDIRRFGNMLSNDGPESMEDHILREEARNFDKKEILTIEDIIPKGLLKESNKEIEELSQEQIQHTKMGNKPKEESQTLSQEPETLNENINSETKDDKFEFPNGKEDGKYLVLRGINNEIEERKFAQKQGYKDTKDLRAACGLKSLIGLYYSSNVYVDSNIIGEYRGNVKIPAKVINKMFFGVPNIVERNVHIYSDLGVALIEKELFDDKIVTYEVPKELKEVISEIPDIANIYKVEEKRFQELKEQAKETGKPIITSTQKPISTPLTQKKTFSSKNITGDYL